MKRRSPRLGGGLTCTPRSSLRAAQWAAAPARCRSPGDGNVGRGGAPAEESSGATPRTLLDRSPAIVRGFGMSALGGRLVGDERPEPDLAPRQALLLQMPVHLLHSGCGDRKLGRQFHD